MNARQRAHFSKRLTAERQRLVRTLQEIVASVPANDGAPGDEPDAGHVGGSPEDDGAVSMRERAAIEEIDAALHLLSEEPERYGVCVICGRPIAAARLELVPATRYCERDAPA